MAFQLSTAVRDARLDSIETTIGNTTVTLKIFSGAEPANCGAADPSGLLCTINLPNPWMASAASGSKSLSGTWSATASATGTAACFRIYDSTPTCHIQGNITASGGGGDMTLDNTSIANGQTVTVTTFTLTDGNA